MTDKREHAGVRGGTVSYLFQHLLLAMFKSARSDDDVQTEIFVIIAFFSTSLSLFPVDRASEPWIQIALVTEPSLEERANALNVTIEIPVYQRKSANDTRSFTWTVMRESHHSAFVCEVLTICGKSMTTGSPVARRIRMLNSLKSP
jgi:hypothetical protein